jgi:hypothetical protein
MATVVKIPGGHMSLVPVPCHTRYFAASPFQHIRGRIAGIQPVAAIFGIGSVQFAGDGQRRAPVAPEVGETDPVAGG